MNMQSAARAILGATFTIVLAAPAWAQKKPSMDEVRAQMAHAQHIVDSVMKIAAPQMSAAKSQAASMGNYGSGGPSDGVGQPKMPDFDKLSKQMDASMADIEKYQGQKHADRNAGLPKQSSTLFSSIPNADSTAIVGFAKGLLPGATAKIQGEGGVLQQALDALLATDTVFTAHANGMLLMANGAPKWVAEYMVCKSILKDATNIWAINDLGILLRGEDNNKDAARCFRYACSIKDSFLLIKCNLAWAVFYTGDFITSKKYFMEIVDKAPAYNSAWEGLGMIAYQQGDIRGMYEALSKQIKTVGAGGDGPSEEFTGFVDGVIQDDKVGGMMKDGGQGSKLADHTLDNENGEEEGNQDEPPTAYVEPPAYPAKMSAMFPNDIEHMVQAMKSIPAFYKNIIDLEKESKARVDGIRTSLPRISPPSYTDDQGLKVTPASSQKYFSLFSWVHEEFEERIKEVYRNFDGEQQKLISSLAAQQMAFAQGWGADQNSCPSGMSAPECEQYLYCKWKPKAKGELGMNLSAISVLWSRYFSKLQDHISWYLAASTPDIKRVHNVKWNDYMNAVRSYDVRSEMLHAYARWIPLLGVAIDGLALEIAAKEIECQTPVREIEGNIPDPAKFKKQKLKTAAEYCDPKEDVDLSTGPLVLQFTCEHTAVGLKLGKSASGDLKGGPIKASGSLEGELGLGIEHVMSKKFKDDNYVQFSTTIGIGADASIKGHVAVDEGPVHGSADGKIEAKANALFTTGWRMDEAGNYLGRVHSTDIDMSASADAKAKGSVDYVGEKTIETKKAIGYKYHGEVFEGAGSAVPVRRSSGGVTH